MITIKGGNSVDVDRDAIQKYLMGFYNAPEYRLKCAWRTERHVPAKVVSDAAYVPDVVEKTRSYVEGYLTFATDIPEHLPNGSYWLVVGIVSDSFEALLPICWSQIAIDINSGVRPGRVSLLVWTQISSL